MVTDATPAGPSRLTAAEFEALYRRLLSRAAWAQGDRGALEALTPARVLAATREVRDRPDGHARRSGGDVAGSGQPGAGEAPDEGAAGG